MAENEETTNAAPTHPISRTKYALEQRLKALDEQIMVLKAERNALARASKSIDRFY